jgi:thymidylate synthase
MIDTQYEDLMRRILAEGDVIDNDRTGTGTWELFGAQLRYDLQKGFPLITTKKVFTKGIFTELVWLLSGDTNIRYLTDNGVHIWDEWADENGDLGPVYGHQWRHWAGEYYPNQPVGSRYDEGEDQITDLIEGLKKDPHSRRHIVTAWDPRSLSEQKLPPCHMMFQCHVDSEGRLSLHLYQRSADMFLGVPFNLASYAALTHMLAAQTGHTVGDFIWTGGSVHVYKNHLDAATRQLKREPHPFPTLALKERDSIFDYEPGDFEVLQYVHHDAIKAEVSV